MIFVPWLNGLLLYQWNGFYALNGMILCLWRWISLPGGMNFMTFFRTLQEKQGFKRSSKHLLFRSWCPWVWPTLCCHAWIHRLCQHSIDTIKLKLKKNEIGSIATKKFKKFLTNLVGATPNLIEVYFYCFLFGCPSFYYFPKAMGSSTILFLL